MTDTPAHPAREITAIIENPAGSTQTKYEINKETGRLAVDRFRKVAIAYPGHYGFVPDTLSGDGDPVDVLVLETTALHPLTEIAVVPIGVLYMEDDKGQDEKIIAVPVARLNSDYSDYAEYAELPEKTRQGIEFFFKNYKSFEPGKWSKLNGIGNAADAWRIIDEGYDRARGLPVAPVVPTEPKP